MRTKDQKFKNKDQIIKKDRLETVNNKVFFHHILRASKSVKVAFIITETHAGAGAAHLLTLSIMSYKTIIKRIVYERFLVIADEKIQIPVLLKNKYPI